MRPDSNRGSSERSRSFSSVVKRASGRIVIAPDKFKGSLTAVEAVRAIERGVRAAWPEREIVRLPMADGGEGTLDAFLASGWERIACRVSGPRGEPIDAAFAFSCESEPRAVVEMAAASGLALLTHDRYDPLRATTFGAGELVREALDRGVRTVIVGLGGSATCDGGAGFLAALGVRLFDSDGRTLERGGAALERLARIDVRELDPRVRGVRFVAAADVDAPLLGTQGASLLFARQKGASPSDVALLERALARFADVAAASLGIDVRSDPGSGAAGGLGFALRAFLDARLARGADIVADARDLSGFLSGAAWCFTGEGSIDEQTLAGKTVLGVAARARAAGARTVALAGRVEARAARALAALGIVVVPIADPPLELGESIARGAELLERAAARIAREIAARED
jgi:glycerate kinase